MLFLTALPLWLSFLLIVVLPKTVGVIYAVLLAFAIVVVWEKFNAAENDVAREASAAATVFRLAEGLNTEHRAAVRSAVTAYLNDGIHKDWPAMERGTGDPDVTNALTNVYTVVLNARAGDRSNEFLLTEILRQLDSFSLTRRTLLVSADGNVPEILWFVLFGGAIVTVSYTFFFGAQPAGANLMTGAVRGGLFRAADGRRDRPPVCRQRESSAGGAHSRAGRFRRRATPLDAGVIPHVLQFPSFRDCPKGRTRNPDANSKAAF